jgi:hypothetical protein
LEIGAEALESFSHSVHIHNLVQVPVSVNSTSLLDERRDERLRAIFANEFSWGVVGLSDLEHYVVVINALSLTLLTQVVVILLGALVADANNFSIAPVAHIALVNLILLLVAAFVFQQDVLKACCTELLDLFLDDFDLVFKTSNIEETPAITVTALLTLALKAVHARLDGLVLGLGFFNLLSGQDAWCHCVNNCRNGGHLGHLRHLRQLRHFWHFRHLE